MRNFYSYAALICLSILSSCTDFVTLDHSATQVSKSQVFSDELMVKSALAGVYSQLTFVTSFAAGNTQTVTMVGSLLSDEFVNRTTFQDFISLNENTVTSVNGPVQGIWNDVFAAIYRANAIIEGVETSNNLRDEFKLESIGQSKFVRALGYFYLTNLFGDVPLLLTTDFRVNRVASRAKQSDVYAQIERDLMDASNSLPKDFSLSSGERTIPNHFAAEALLARVYLYQGKWAEAESHATTVIGNSLYKLSPTAGVFLKNSTEAIWQLRTGDPAVNTNEANVMVAVSSSGRVTLTNGLLAAFESGDSRRSTWVGLFQNASVTINFPSKYKVNLRNQPITEYYMVMRLAEQFLIRAEARAKQGNIEGAISDLNMIRARANLSLLVSSGQTAEQVFQSIHKERRVELFAEWGHRWLDLKRTGVANEALSYKTGWDAKDVWLPIPQSEITVNPNLKQNE